MGEAGDYSYLPTRERPLVLLRAGEHCTLDDERTLRMAEAICPVQVEQFLPPAKTDPPSPPWWLLLILSLLDVMCLGRRATTAERVRIMDAFASRYAAPMNAGQLPIRIVPTPSYPMTDQLRASNAACRFLRTNPATGEKMWCTLGEAEQWTGRAHTNEDADHDRYRHTTARMELRLERPEASWIDTYTMPPTNASRYISSAPPPGLSEEEVALCIKLLASGDPAAIDLMQHATGHQMLRITERYNALQMQPGTYAGMQTVTRRRKLPEG